MDLATIPAEVALSHINEIDELLREKRLITTKTFPLKFKYPPSALSTLPVSTVSELDLSSRRYNSGPCELSSDGQSTSELLLYEQWLLQSAKVTERYGRIGSVHLRYKCSVVSKGLASAFGDLDTFKAAEWRRQEDQARREQGEKGYLKRIGTAAYREAELGSRILDRATVARHRTYNRYDLPPHRCPAPPLRGFH